MVVMEADVMECLVVMEADVIGCPVVMEACFIFLLHMHICINPKWPPLTILNF